MDICVVTYRNTAERIERAIRPKDRLWVRDNTVDNIGFGAACNELAAKGSHPVILFVNPDGDPQPNCFDTLEAAFRHSEVIAAGIYDGSEGSGAAWLVGSCLAVRRQAFVKVGGFDESLFLYWEDVDLSWKLSKHGRLVVLPGVFNHDRHSYGKRVTYYMIRNRLIVTNRWGQPWTEPFRVRTSLYYALGMLSKGQIAIASIYLAASVAYVVNRRRR